MNRRHAWKTLGAWPIAIAIALGFGLKAPEAAASETQLIGTWKMDRIVKGKEEKRPPAGTTVTMQFKGDHTMIGRMVRGRKVQIKKGRWTLTGSTLVTTMRGKPAQAMTVTFVGAHLELTKKGRPEKLVLKRVQ